MLRLRAEAQEAERRGVERPMLRERPRVQGRRDRVAVIGKCTILQIRPLCVNQPRLLGEGKSNPSLGKTATPVREDGSRRKGSWEVETVPQCPAAFWPLEGECAEKWYNMRHEETIGNKERENGVGALVQEQLAQMLWYWR